MTHLAADHPVRSRSEALLQRTRNSLASGDNGTMRVLRRHFPLVVDRGAGCRIWDADDFADFVNLYDIGVYHRGGGLGLVVKPLNVSVVLRQVGPQHLESDLPFERVLLRQVDVGHATAAQPAQHTIVAQLAPREVGLQRRFADGVGGARSQ